MSSRSSRPPRRHEQLRPVAGGVPLEQLAAMARDKKVGVRLAAVADANTPAEVLVALAEDSSPNVRRALARRHPAPPEALRALVRDADWKVRDALAENDGCPPDVLLELIDDPHWSVRTSVPFNPRADDRVRAAILRSTDELLRYLLVHAHSLGTATKAVLAADRSPKVRGAVAQWTDDPGLLDALVDDPDVSVRCNAATNEQTTPDQRRRLARDPAAKVRGAVALSELAEDELQLLARDRSVNVRWWLAASRSTPQHIRDLLRNDPHPDVRSQALADHWRRR